MCHFFGLSSTEQLMLCCRPIVLNGISTVNEFCSLVSNGLSAVLSDSFAVYPPRSDSLTVYPPRSDSFTVYPPRSDSFTVYPPRSDSFTVYPPRTARVCGGSVPFPPGQICLHGPRGLCSLVTTVIPSMVGELCK